MLNLYKSFVRTLLSAIAPLCLLAMTPSMGCSNASTRTVVTRPLVSETRSATLTLDEDQLGAAVPDAQRRAFRSMLEQRLFASNAFARGDGVVLRYTFIEFEPGSRAGRWLLGATSIGSEANVTVRCDYRGKDGNTLSIAEVNSRLAGGMLGGSIDSSLGRTADKVSDYTVTRFAAR